MFETKFLKKLIPEVAPLYSECMSSINSLQFDKASSVIVSFNDAVLDVASDSFEADDVLNELYVLRSIPNILDCYLKFWKSITESRLKESWNHLQDCLSCLRLLKRYSPRQSTSIVNFFEAQLVELEKLYPYKMFASVGMLVESFRCSICGNDIDSFDCEHIRGELYRGRMAIAVATGIRELNHIALVSNPADKKCVIDYDENSASFRAVRYLSDLISERKLLPTDFQQVEITPKLFPNQSYVKLSRNDNCFCGSGKKFKKCCLDRKYLKGEHFELIAKRNIHSLPSSGTTKPVLIATHDFTFQAGHFGQLDR